MAFIGIIGDAGSIVAIDVVRFLVSWDDALTRLHILRMFT